MNKIKIALESTLKDKKKPKKTAYVKPAKNHEEKLYTIDEIKRDLFGFRLVTDPEKIAEGAVIKYIRVDGEDAYKYRAGGYLSMNAGTIFHLQSPYGARWQIYTDPQKNIIFYYYPQHIKAIAVNRIIKFLSKEEIEDSGEGVISQLTPGSLSALMINSHVGGAIPIAKKEEIVSEIIEKSNYNNDYVGIAPKELKTVILPKTKIVEETPKVVLASKDTTKKPIIPPSAKVKEKKPTKARSSSYESSYSLPDYSYYSDSDHIKRNKALSIPKKMNNGKNKK